MSRREPLVFITEINLADPRHRSALHRAHWIPPADRDRLLARHSGWAVLIVKNPTARPALSAV